MLRHLTSKIKATGPIPVAEYMREVLTNPVAVSTTHLHLGCSRTVSLAQGFSTDFEPGTTILTKNQPEADHEERSRD